MRRSFLLKSMLLLCALVAGSSSVWAETITFDATTAVTSNVSNYSTTEASFTVDSYTWKAKGYGTVANQSITIGKGGANYLETPLLDKNISSVEVTWSGNASHYLALQTPDGTELEAKANPSSPETNTFTITSGNYKQLRLVGRRSSGTNNAAATITKVVVTYGTTVAVGIQKIDFEATALSQYSDWEFANVAIRTGVTGVSAHGGSKWGGNVNSDGHGVGTCSITTKAKIAYPGTFTCYISKESTNTGASTWKIQTSSNGSTWTDVASKSASGMTKGQWEEFSADLSSYTNVYVRLSYGSSTAIRAVDDITLTEYVSYTMNDYQWSTLVSDRPLDFTGSKVKAYIVTGNEGNVLTKTQMTGIVPANTPLLLNATAGAHKITVAANNPADVSGNKLVAGTGAKVSAESGKTKYVLSVENEKATFLKIASDAATVPVGKAYLEFDEEINAPALDFGDATGIKSLTPVLSEGEGAVYDLQGRKVAQPTKGLYIVNGRKVVVK